MSYSKPASNHPQAYEFRRQVDYDGEQEVSLKIYFNPFASLPKLQIAFFVAGVGRIYGLCMNNSHGGMLMHKHNGKREDDNPYVPIDITAQANDPQAVWKEFCTESSLAHNGVFLVETEGAMDTTSNGSIATRICASLHTQIGSLFECLPAGERVQIRTPFIFPDGDLIDLYWRDTPRGEVISDLGDTCGGSL